MVNVTPKALGKTDTLSWIFQIWAWRVHQLRCVFAQNSSSYNALWKKTEFTSSNDELVSDFNKPFVRESDNRENFIVWSRSWRCIMIAFVHILKCQLSSLSSCWKNWNHIWRSRETISKSQLRAVLWHNNNQMFRHVGCFNCAPLQTEKINLGNSSCVNMHSVWTAALIGEKGESEKYF